MAASDDTKVLHSHSYPLLIGDGEGDEHEPCKVGTLFNVVGAANEVVMQKGEVVHPIVGEVIESKERSQRM